ncbi:uncharacterized protein LOC110855379 [Folsomia candida]|uniref:uncharacterized protein LOC110855379 n=1 Tax=Folsomia candida TaxID=158441 RepID=UPI00160531F3|nr:uncharacterized protein LOC110855379 [Folsomia candida]XP_035711967.1 uncharacterized protein LOC110855379 [Folsomia candida]
MMSTSQEDHFASDFLSPISQGLLNCAPNLEKFELKGNFYPDLTPCRKLEEFKFAYQGAEYSNQVLDIHELTRMLENCRDSLKKLTFGDHGRLRDGPFKLDFHFPNLTHLKLEASMAYEIEDSLNITNLPKLTHLWISASNNISVMIENYHSRHAGITSLHVGCAFYPENENNDGQASVKLVNLFPAVNKFKLNVAIEFILHEDPFNPYSRLQFDVQAQDLLSLKETLQSLAGWGLTCGGHVEIKLNWLRGYCPPEDLDLVGTSVLQGVSEWRGLENTDVKFVNNWVGGQFALLDGMRDALLSCRTIRSVTCDEFEMSENDAAEFYAFIGENNLPMNVPDPGWWPSDLA